METTIKTKYGIGDAVRLYDGSYTFTIEEINIAYSKDETEISYWGVLKDSDGHIHSHYLSEIFLMADEYKEGKQ